ncbi:hypothetical protein K474DRAFT_1675023 [Panus rudis PR-1116 ss-1]|nr:hypothetical protein K474DRAFT_1675023 [Panus rudis PR-1116 ss-1]
MSSTSVRLPRYAVCTPQEAAEYAVLTRKGHWDLSPSELFWRDRYEFLSSKGYNLRPRLHPSWKPSWINTNRDPDFCEDSIISLLFRVIDASRRSDGATVMIKSILKSRREKDIALFLSRDSIREEPANHCVHILDVLDDPLDSGRELLIMPYLRPFNDPEFCTIGEVVDFIHQTLEGLVFIHRQGVAHRDPAAANIMMDGGPLYPKGHHPVRMDYTPDALFDAPHYSRTERPVKYSFIDFGISSRFKPGQPRAVVGTKGRDKSPPEMSDDIPYDPFPLDVFVLGHLYYEEFIEKYYDFDFLRPLTMAMTHPQPDRRPTSEDSYRMFTEIRSTLDEVALRWRLRSRSESIPARVVYDTVSVAREGLFRLKRLVAGGGT